MNSEYILSLHYVTDLCCAMLVEKDVILIQGGQVVGLSCVSCLMGT